jgi:hypothetical protein
MKTAFFTKRTHPENRRKVNNGGVKGGFFWRPNHASKCQERTHSNPFKPSQTSCDCMKAKTLQPGWFMNIVPLQKNSANLLPLCC